MESDQNRASSSSEDQQGPRYYCRGCGKPLSPGVRSHFHKDCLRSDKRARVREQRRREQERYKRWFRNQRCPKCGATYSDQGSGGAIEASCEASQPTQQRETQVECGSAPEMEERAGE
jgi:hypothetical protein